MRVKVSDAPYSIAAIKGGITAAAGFRAAGVAAGIKASGALDVTLIVADAPVPAAGVFTTNQVQAAPVKVSRANLVSSGGHAQAVIVNSGCANACTGAEGLATTEATVAATAAGARLRAAARARRVHRGHRRSALARQDRRRREVRSRGALARRRDGRARHHDDRPRPEGARRSCRDRRRRLPCRRHREGRRHDRADAGDDAVVHHDGRGSPAGAAGAGAARGDGAHVQRDHRGRRVLDQRHAGGACQRREWSHDRRVELPGARGRARGRRADAGPGDRPRRRGRDQARGGAHHGRGRTIRTRCARRRRSRTRRS